MKEILDTPKRVEVVRAEEPSPPVPNAMTAEEYDADVAEDEAEAEVLNAEEPLGHDPDGCDECLATEAAEAEAHPSDYPDHPAAVKADVEPEPVEEPAPPLEPRTYIFDLRVKPFRTFLSQLDVLAEDVKLIVTKQGFSVKTVDPAHIAMISVSLSDVVDGFEQKPDVATRDFEPFEVGIDVPKLVGLLKGAKKDELLRVRMDLPDASGRDRLTFYLAGRTRVVGAIDTAGMSDPKIPSFSWKGSIELDAKTLLDAVKPCGEISDHVVLTLTKDGLNVYAEGDVDKETRDITGPEVHETRIPVDAEKLRSIYPLEYLTDFLKAVKDERLVLQLSDDAPLRADWDGVTKGTYLLAPRIESQ